MQAVNKDEDRRGSGHDFKLLCRYSPRDQTTNLTVLSPLVLAANLLLLLGGEVVSNVECLSDLLWGFALDHVCDSLTANVKQRLDVEVVGGEDDFEKHFLVNLHELLVPLLDISCLLARVGVIVGGRGGIALVMFTPFNNLSEDGLIDVGDRDICGQVLAEILNHVFDEDGFHGDLLFNFDGDIVIADKVDIGSLRRHLECM